MREGQLRVMRRINEKLQNLQATARYQADQLLFAVIYYSLAQQQLKQWRPELEQAEARLADLQGQHAELLAQWKEAKAEAEAKKREWQQARALGAPNRAGLEHACTLSLRKADGLVGELTALDQDIEPLGDRVTQLQRGVKTLEAVTLPELPEALAEWLTGGD